MGPPPPVPAWPSYPQRPCPDAFGLLQEETQGQGEEEEREAETHRLSPVSAREPRDGKEAEPQGRPCPTPPSQHGVSGQGLERGKTQRLLGPRAGSCTCSQDPWDSQELWFLPCLSTESLCGLDQLISPFLGLVLLGNRMRGRAHCQQALAELEMASLGCKRRASPHWLSGPASFPRYLPILACPPRGWQAGTSGLRIAGMKGIEKGRPPKPTTGAS